MLSWIKQNVWSDTQPATEFARNKSDDKALAYLVPRKFESLEIWLLLFIGVYGLLVAVVAARGAREIMLACVGLICMAVWRRYHPVRNKTQWAIGAVVVLVIVSLIYINPSSGGSNGPFLFFLIILAISYPLLMDTPIATVYALCLLVVYFATGWQKIGAVSPELFVLRGVLLASLCALSTRFGMVIRQTEAGVDRLRRDMASLTYNEHGLARYGGRLLHACAQQAQPCTLVLLPLPKNWHAPIDVSGRGSDYSATNSLILQTRALRDMAMHLSLAMPNDTVVSRNAQGDWVLLVPWMERQAALDMLELAFGRPVQLPFGPRGDEMFVTITPCAVLHNGEGDSLEAMMARAQDIWLRGVRTGVVDSDF
jgi:hypothetical protein